MNTEEIENETQEITLTLDELISRLDKDYELVYVDYRDDLSERMEEIQAAVQTQDWEPLDTLLFDGEWYDESRYDAAMEAIKNLQDDLEREFDWEDEGELDDLIEEYEDELRYAIEDRDVSNPLADLIRHTSDPVCFYDTGVYLDENMFDNRQFGIDIRRIKSALKIKGHEYDQDLRLMLSQASYGGHLVIYFTGDIQEMMKISENGWNTVTFENPMVAIIDMFNGSGDHTDLPKHKFSLPLDPKNIFFDKTFKYSYTYSVCGMYSNWCSCTDVKFTKEEKKSKSKTSGLHAENEKEAGYKKTYKEGGCTLGDIDIHRHRDTFYLNEFPCGTHCPHCGMFWID